MQQLTVRWAFVGGLVLGALAVAWFSMGGGESPSGDGLAEVSRGTPLPAPVATVQRGEPAAAVDPVPVVEDLAAARAADELAARRALADPKYRLSPSVRPFDSPEAASAFVTSKVVDVFAAIAPEIDPKDIAQECAPDGRQCTFTGPWPGDDLLKRWVVAISDGKTGTEALDGVRFANIAKRGEGDAAQFELVAHAP